MKKAPYHPETSSEIQYTKDNKIESLEVIHHHLKFIVMNLNHQTPLAKYLNKEVIKFYLEKEEMEDVEIVNEHLKIERIGKKNAKKGKKKWLLYNYLWLRYPYILCFDIKFFFGKGK